MALVTCGLTLAIALETWETRQWGSPPIEATWLRGPALLAATVLAGLVLWIALALLSYGVRLTPRRAAAVLGIASIGAGHLYATTDWDVPLDDGFVPAALVGRVPSGLDGTVWRGFTADCGIYLSELRFEANGRVVATQWETQSWVSLPVHQFRIRPHTASHAHESRRVGDIITWDEVALERVWRENGRLHRGTVARSDVTVGAAWP